MFYKYCQMRRKYLSNCFIWGDYKLFGDFNFQNEHHELHLEFILQHCLLSQNTTFTSGLSAQMSFSLIKLIFHGSYFYYSILSHHYAQLSQMSLYVHYCIHQGHRNLFLSQSSHFLFCPLMCLTFKKPHDQNLLE